MEYKFQDCQTEIIKNMMCKAFRGLADDIENDRYIVDEFDYGFDLLETIHKDNRSRRRMAGPKYINIKYRDKDPHKNHSDLATYNNEYLGDFKRRKGCYFAVLMRDGENCCYETIVCCSDDGIFEHGKETDSSHKVISINEYPATGGIRLDKEEDDYIDAKRKDVIERHLKGGEITSEDMDTMGYRYENIDDFCEFLNDVCLGNLKTILQGRR